MNALLPLDGVELWHLAGWTMVHFLWLGALVAVAAAMCRFFLRRTSPSIRYAFMCAWLLALAALPFGTAAWLYAKSPLLKGGARGGIAADVAITTSAPPTIELHQPELDATAARPPAPLASGASPNLSPQTSASPNPSQPTTTHTTFWPSTLNSRLSTLGTIIPYLPWLWLIGTPITFALVITGVVGTRRLNRASHTLREGPIPALLSQLTESLRIGRRVTVSICDRIAAPVLIGILRPVILLPPAALTGWSPDEIEMVLLHELAHVRRWDNLANLLQRIVESLLFFHPAVWIISSWVRSDREACCDALVVRRTNRPHAYAEMLVALAAQMPRSVLFHPAASSAMAAGPLRSRIRRILQLEDDPMLVSGKSLMLVFGALALAATLGVLYVPTIGEAKEKPAKPVAKSEGEAPATSGDKSDTKNTSDVKKLLARFDIDPTQELSGEDASIIAELFNPIPPNPTESRKYAVADKQRRIWDDTVKAFKNGPLNKHIKFKQKWDEESSSIEIMAPKLALDGFFDPLIHSIQNDDIFDEPTSGSDSSLRSPFATNEKPQSSAGNQPADAFSGHALPPVPPTSDLMAEALSRNNMKAISIAALNYEASKLSKSLAPHAIYSTDGKPLLSWRVALLPYLGEQELYSQFHLDEPWDSEHNRKLVARIPILYVIPKVNLPPVYAGKTNYLAVVGPECVFDGTAKGSKLQDITDGTANTIAFVEANVDQAVEWTKPDDWQFDRQHPTKGLGTVWTGHWNAAFVDGSQLHFSNKNPADAVGILFTRAGGESKSLAESANRAQAVEGAGAGGPEGGLSVLDGASSKFPSLEDQKLADLAWKRLNLELEPIANDDLKLVKALGYDGGVKVVSGSAGIQGSNERIQPADILVGLHVWPTMSMKDVATVLDRDDLSELNPLKFYVVRHEQTGPPSADNPNEMTFRDVVHTGRLTVQNPGGGFGGSRTKPTRNAPSASSDAWPSTPTTNTWPPVNPNDLWQSAPAAGPPLEPAYPQGRGGAAPATQPVPANDLPGVPKSPFQTLPTAPALNSNDANVSPPGTAPVFAPPPTDSYAVPPPATVNVPGAAPPSGALMAFAGRATGLPAPSASNSKADLRYDDKTFEMWRNTWKTELSTEKRLEAVKALAAFGRAGYGKEATETMLDVAGEYDFYTIDSSTEGKLKQTVLDELAPLERTQSLAPYWVPDLAARLQKDPKKWKWLGIFVFGRLNSDDKATLANLQSLAASADADFRGTFLGALIRSSSPRGGAQQIDEKTRNLIDDALQSKDSAIILATLPELLHYPQGGGGGGYGGAPPQLIYWPAKCPSLLFHADKDVRFQARRVAHYIDEKDAPQLVVQLLAILKDKSRDEDHIEAIRALAALGDKAAKASPDFVNILKSSDDQATLDAAIAALLRSANKPVSFASGGGKSANLDVLDELLGKQLTADEVAALAKKIGRTTEDSTRKLIDRLTAEDAVLPPLTNSNLGGGGFF